MIFTLVFLVNFGRLMLDGAPLFLSLGTIISGLALAIGRLEGWKASDSLYFGFITATTVGYGDLIPVNGWSKLISIILSVIGLITRVVST